MDIGDAEFTSSSNYTFKIFEVPIWSGGSTAIPTDRADVKGKHEVSFMTTTIIWMVIAIIFANILQKNNFHRLPETTHVVIFGILGGFLLRFGNSNISSVCYLICLYRIINRVLYLILLYSLCSYLLSLCSILALAYKPKVYFSKTLVQSSFMP